MSNPKPVVELGDGGQGIQGVSGAQGVWLKKAITEVPRGTNTIYVTHIPNIARAFPELATGVTDGEALVFPTIKAERLSWQESG